MSSFRNCFSNSFFDHRHISKAHAGQVILVLVAMALVIGSISTKPAGIPTTRADTIGIVMGAKSLVFLAYELLTMHVGRLKRWGSSKAYLILNCLEIPFWFVVMILTFMGVSRFCDGVSCGLSIVVAFVALLLVSLAFWVAVVTWRERKYSSQKAAAVPLGNYSY